MMTRIVKYALGVSLSVLIATQSTAAVSETLVDPDCARLECDEDVEYVLEILDTAAASVDELLGPQNTNIRVVLTDSSRFDYEYRADEQYRDVITIGGEFINSMYQGSEDDELTFEAFLEWAFYHEVGHAVLNSWEVQGNEKIDDSAHEVFSDIFATVLLLEELDTEDAEDAAFGMLGLIVPEAEEKITAYKRRKGFDDTPRNRRDIDERRKLAADAGQVMGVHQPTEVRVDNILCMADMKYVYDKTQTLPEPEEGCDQGLDEMVTMILETFYTD